MEFRYTHVHLIQEAIILYFTSTVVDGTVARRPRNFHLDRMFGPMFGGRRQRLSPQSIYESRIVISERNVCWKGIGLMLLEGGFGVRIPFTRAL